MKQTRALLKVMEEEQKKGNYVIAGGDFNQTFSNVDIGKYPSSEDIWTPGKIDANDFGKDWNLLMATTTCWTVLSCPRICRWIP